jgi:hypothetical protein
VQAGGQVLFVHALPLAGIAREFERKVVEFMRPVAAFFVVHRCPLIEASSRTGKEIRKASLPALFLVQELA